MLKEKNNIVLDLMGLDEDALLSMKTEIDADICSIRTQIERAKDEAREYEEYADQEWWRKANTALKIKGVQSQQIQNRLGFIKRKRKDEMRVERHFVVEAKAVLPDSVFQEIAEKARQASRTADVSPGDILREG